jgi:magnesium transporter
MIMEGIYPSTQSFIFTFFSKIINNDVIDNSNDLVGNVYDILAVKTEIYPKAIMLVIKCGFINRKYACIPWESIAELNEQVRLKVNHTSLKFTKYREPKTEISLRRDILDHQVVDTFNRRVVRVNDLHLLKVGNDIMVAHIDVGPRGLMRRLGFNKVVDFTVALFTRDSQYLTKENFISWKNVQLLSVNPASHSFKVKVPYQQLTNIHPVELSEIIVDLGPEEKTALFRALDTATKAKVFANVDIATQRFLVQGMDIDKIAELISSLPGDEAADFLDQIPKETVDQLFNVLERGRAKKLSTLLGYASDSAGGLMTTEYIAVPETMPVSDVLQKVKDVNLKSEVRYHIYIVDEKNRLTGNTTLVRLLTAAPDQKIIEISSPKTTTVHLEDSVKEVAFLMERYKLYALPVIDENQSLQGIITVDDILEQLIALTWRRRRRR